LYLDTIPTFILLSGWVPADSRAVDESIIKPGPSETVIGGAWTVVAGKVQGDAAAARIQELVAWHLQVVAADSAGGDALLPWCT
jgi:hypothetical protein